MREKGKKYSKGCGFPQMLLGYNLGVVSPLSLKEQKHMWMVRTEN